MTEPDPNDSEQRREQAALAQLDRILNEPASSWPSPYTAARHLGLTITVVRSRMAAVRAQRTYAAQAARTSAKPAKPKPAEASPDTSPSVDDTVDGEQKLAELIASGGVTPTDTLNGLAQRFGLSVVYIRQTTRAAGLRLPDHHRRS